MKKIVSCSYIGDYRLLVTFNNGEKKVYNQEELGFDGFWAYLKNTDNFHNVELVDGALTWFRPNDFELDLCPDYTYMVSKPYENEIVATH